VGSEAMKRTLILGALALAVVVFHLTYKEPSEPQCPVALNLAGRTDALFYCLWERAK
jgi:hypothetical protein